jgi:excisionase family DNA binding protein
MVMRAKAKARNRAARSVAPSEATRPEIFTTPGAARYLGVGESTLRFWRANGEGEGPKYFHAGPRLVRYRKADLDAWVESRLNK